MGPFAPKGTDKHFDKQAAIDCLKSWQFWIFAICYFCFTNSLNAFGYFAPTIVASLGFKGPMAQLQTVWPNVFAFFVIIGNSWHSDRTKERPLHILGGKSLPHYRHLSGSVELTLPLRNSAGTSLVMIGYLLLATVKNNPGRYVGVFFIACTNAAVIPL